MTRDPKQTQTMEEPPQRPSSEQDLAMRTTLVQPIPLSRHPDFVRTRYWEKLSGEAEEPKRSAASYTSAGKTVVGLGPDDPIVQAVQAAKQQLLEAERAQRERTSHERPRVAEVARANSASTAQTVLMPALDVMQLMASRARSALTGASDEPVQLPKRKLKPFLIGGAALAVIVCAASAGHFMPASAPEESFVKPRPQPQQSGTITPAPAIHTAPAAVSFNAAPAPAPQVQVTEKAAVDALFAGDYALAGRHYATLASAHAEQPAFGEAARILKRNARPDAK